MGDVGRADRVGGALRLLLRAALGGPGEADRAWHAWCAHPDRDADDPRVARLLPLVCSNLRQHGGDPPAWLRRAYLQSLGAGNDLMVATAGAVRRLAEAGIQTLALKGIALAALHYRDPGARPMGDADLAVPADSADEALRVLAAHGWRGGERGRSPAQHALPLKDARGHRLDLHWHACYEARFPEADAAWWARAVPCEIAGATTLAPAASDQVLLSVVHGLRWSSVPSLAWIPDVVTIARGRALDPQGLAAEAGRLRLAWPLRQGLALVRSATGESTAIEACLALLARDPVPLVDRVEQHNRVRAPDGPLGALPNLWFASRRSHPTGRPAAGEFGRMLRATWGLSEQAPLWRPLLAKAVRRVRSALPRRPQSATSAKFPPPTPSVSVEASEPVSPSMPEASLVWSPASDASVPSVEAAAARPGVSTVITSGARRAEPKPRRETPGEDA